MSLHLRKKQAWWRMLAMLLMPIIFCVTILSLARKAMLFNPQNPVLLETPPCPSPFKAPAPGFNASQPDYYQSVFNSSMTVDALKFLEAGCLRQQGFIDPDVRIPPLLHYGASKIDGSMKAKCQGTPLSVSAKDRCRAIHCSSPAKYQQPNRESWLS
jgi:hypothetical protein